MRRRFNPELVCFSKHSQFRWFLTKNATFLLLYWLSSSETLVCFVDVCYLTWNSPLPHGWDIPDTIRDKSVQPCMNPLLLRSHPCLQQIHHFMSSTSVCRADWHHDLFTWLSYRANLSVENTFIFCRVHKPLWGRQSVSSVLLCHGDSVTDFHVSKQSSPLSVVPGISCTELEAEPSAIRLLCGGTDSCVSSGGRRHLCL